MLLLRSRYISTGVGCLVGGGGIRRQIGEEGAVRGAKGNRRTRRSKGGGERGRGEASGLC